MLKKLLFTSICTVALATSGYAAELKINADVEAYYKAQTDYRTPLDSADWLDANGAGGGKSYEDGFDDRGGANNRSSQTARAHGNVDFIGLAGENDFDGTTWYNFIGFMRLKLDANDPDDNYGSDQEKDGSYVDKASIGDLWVRYSPAAMVGIKIGTQTIAATANAYGIGHKFVGDKDDDFVFYTAGVVDEKPGISIDLHLSKDIELGVAMLQGMGDLSKIISGGSSAQANNTVLWFKGNFGMIEATLGHQSISVGDNDSSTDDGSTVNTDDTFGEWGHGYAHTITNAVVKVNIGDFSPFIGYQAASGEAASAKTGLGSPTCQSTAVNNNICPSDDERAINLSSITLGLLANLGPGKLAAEYTTITAPEWGEKDYVLAVLEVDSTIHINYQYPITENASITAFYNSLTTKEDKKLREDIETLEASSVAAARPLGAFTWSSSSSVGLSFQMKYGN